MALETILIFLVRETYEEDIAKKRTLFLHVSTFRFISYKNKVLLTPIAFILLLQCLLLQPFICDNTLVRTYNGFTSKTAPRKTCTINQDCKSRICS